jgi:hypothetical protein
LTTEEDGTELLLYDLSVKNYAIVPSPLKKKRTDLWSHTKPALNPQPSIERMKIMASHSSATARLETPHVSKTTRTTTTSDALRRRAQSVINNKTIDPQWRAIIRAALELNDRGLSEFVRRAEAGENIGDTFESLRASVPNEVDFTLRKIEALTEIICRAGDQSAVSLFILMETLESSTDPKVIANRAKHVAFSHCGELHVYETIDAQIAEVERQFLPRNTLTS